MQTNSLAGRKFLLCQNNGVVAVASEETVKNIQRKNQITQRINQRYHGVATKALEHLDGSIFTFCWNADDLEKRPWFTSESQMLGVLMDYIKQQGGRVDDGSFHVPFSNAMETGVHGENALASELSHVTTEEDFFEEFGISIPNLWAQRKVRDSIDQTFHQGSLAIRCGLGKDS